MSNDPAETRNLAAEQPERLREMIERWYTEAGKYGVLPIASAGLARMNAERPAVHPVGPFVFYPDGAPVPFTAAPRLYNRPFSITAEVVIPDGGAEGMLLSQGNRHGGLRPLVKDGGLHHVYNYLGLERFTVASPDLFPAGGHVLRYEFEPTGDARLHRGGRRRPAASSTSTTSSSGRSTCPTPSRHVRHRRVQLRLRSVRRRRPDLYAAPFPFTGEIDGSRSTCRAN